MKKSLLLRGPKRPGRDRSVSTSKEVRNEGLNQERKAAEILSASESRNESIAKGRWSFKNLQV